jgi:hypothetical protein
MRRLPVRAARCGGRHVATPLHSGAVTSADRPLDELAQTAAPALRAVRRHAPRIVVGLALLVTVLAVLALIGAAVDDAVIDGDRGVATAEVLDGSTFARTLVRFTVAGGQAIVPERGVQYPRGLAAGDTVAVEYDLSDPEQVRVAGRNVVDGIVPTVLGVAAVWAVLGPLAVWLRRRAERRPAAAPPA